MLEKYLIEHCSPTLASLKTANLFTLPQVAKENVDEQLQHWQNKLGKKGISLQILWENQKTMLIYVVRKDRLQNDLKKPGVSKFLSDCGYPETDVESALVRLKSRLALGGRFPHEIGLFLGYPLEDVVGFIENAGQNCKCIGCWKVYCNECEARKTFAKYKKCKDIYFRLWSQGKSVCQLTVAV